MKKIKNLKFKLKIILSIILILFGVTIVFGKVGEKMNYSHQQ